MAWVPPASLPGASPAQDKGTKPPAPGQGAVSRPPPSPACPCSAGGSRLPIPPTWDERRSVGFGMPRRAGGAPALCSRAALCSPAPGRSRLGAGGLTKGLFCPGKAQRWALSKGANNYVLPARTCEKCHRSKKKMEEGEEEEALPSSPIKYNICLQRFCSKSCLGTAGLRDAPFPRSTSALLQAASNFPLAALALPQRLP